MDGDIRKLRVGIIGCGRISVMHLIPLQTIKEAEVVACCDIKRERAEETAKKYGLTAYESYEEMLDKENLDCVHICLPHYLHSKAAICAFKHGVNVLCEKPMDVDYESAERAVKTAKERGVLYGVIFQCRYNNSAQLVKKAVESGRLGKILSARSTLTWTRPDEYYAESDWKGTWDKEGGGLIIDQAIHSIDLVNWIVGSEAESVSVSMANRGHKCVKVEDSAEGLITYKNGVKYGFYAMNNYACDEVCAAKKEKSFSGTTTRISNTPTGRRKRRIRTRTPWNTRAGKTIGAFSTCGKSGSFITLALAKSRLKSTAKKR